MVPWFVLARCGPTSAVCFSCCWLTQSSPSWLVFRKGMEWTFFLAMALKFGLGTNEPFTASPEFEHKFSWVLDGKPMLYYTAHWAPYSQPDSGAILNSPPLPWVGDTVLQARCFGNDFGLWRETPWMQGWPVAIILGINLSTKHIPAFQARLPPKVLRLLKGSLPLLDLRMAAREAITQMI